MRAWQQCATLLSFDSLMGSSGGVIQPALGWSADFCCYAVSFVLSDCTLG
jgi:hypothetical protein